MNMDKNSARNSLFQIVFFLVTIAVLLFVFKHQLITLYTSGEINITGIILNGLILILFLLGLLRMMITLLRYMREYRTLYRLVGYLQENASDPIARLSQNALSVKRYKYVHWISQQGAAVDQAALATTLSANEGSRLTFIRFIHSILILVGVFGTVVSLSLALVGASSLLGSPESSHQMGAVIGGMSSALSTTMTAIICFIIYAYFYLRLNDARIQLLSGIEDATTLYMLPKIGHSEESLLYHLTDLTMALNKSADRIARVEKKFILAANQLQQASIELNKGVDKTGMNEVLAVLREGFRLATTDNDLPVHSTTVEEQPKDKTTGDKPEKDSKKRMFRGFTS
jgi:biopolymer transport protein ExbB/TolQ